ncbi:hypothetical protein [Halomarina ordinaria]|uniref:Uncharacterized protein n=1 Tax=Halomarina ordinaria TaxID=3033939 RepID=A0ABD5U831_9EURY|nr:hypothetical protein [Halomarina sp. PSRA2]
MSTREPFGCHHLTVVPENFDPDAGRERRRAWPSGPAPDGLETADADADGDVDTPTDRSE